MTDPVRPVRNPSAYLLLFGCLVCALVSIHLWVGPDGRPRAASAVQPATAFSIATWLPTPVSRDGSSLRLLDRSFYRIGYDEAACNPAWAVYLVAGPVVHHEQERRPAQFATDLQTSAQVTQRDYNGSGFDRGHLCPAYAVFSRHGAQAMATTFVMSNVVPQVHQMNAGVWKDIELAIAGEHGWAERLQGVWVLTGPLYERRPPRRLANGTWVPSACWMVVLRRQGTGVAALAFIVPNTASVSGPIARHLCSLAEVERQSGLDLLAGMPTDLADAIRRQPAAAAPW